MDFKLIICSAAVGLLVASCFDDKYDLSDIDTTTRVEVNDLVIPVNLGEVKLSDVISLDDDSPVKIVNINGVDYYAVTRTGSFSSNPITIKKPVASTPSLESKEATLYGTDGKYILIETGNDFTFSCNDVDKSIVAINNVVVTGLDFNIVFKTPGIENATYDNVRLQLPKGMAGSATNGSYSEDTGVWTLNNLAVTNGVAKAVYTAKSIDFTKNEFSFVSPKFDFTSNFSILGGELNISGSDAPATVGFAVDFSLGTLEVSEVSGEIKYEIEGMNIADINLGDLPTFLNGENTDIILANPLICLQTSNPVAGNNLKYSAGLSLTPYRDGVAGTTLASNAFTIGYNKGVDGKYNTVLSETKPSYVPAEYADGYEWCEFANLGKLLSGKGLPTAIGVKANNPQIPTQAVTNFALGVDLPGVVGSYEMFAPLAFANGSVIYYNDVKDGWNEDIKDLTINQLTLEALGTNNTPLDAQLTIYPLDVNGNRIGTASLTSTELKAGQADIPVTFTLTGEIKDLDGVEFFATVNAGNSQTVSPEQTILFKNVRVKVTGFYEKEL